MFDSEPCLENGIADVDIVSCWRRVIEVGEDEQ